MADADRVRAGHLSYFGYPEVTLPNPVDWNHDLVSGFRWPSTDSVTINYRMAAGDPKWIWELNRLQHLPRLAEAWLFTGDDGYAELALEQLDSWIDANPVGVGIAWRGAFEAGVRAVSVALALQGLRDSDALTPERFEKSVRMLASSAGVCWRDRSRFSSANNHLVGELTGLATVAMLFPELAPAARWEQRALRALTLEASRQILPDGSGAEQAVSYQVFTAELLAIVATLLSSRGDAPPAGISDAIERSANYLAAVVGDSDPEPRYGDDDEGFAIRLGPEPRRGVRDHLGIVAALTGSGRALRTGTTTLTAAWTGAAAGPARSDRLAQAPATGSLIARHGGLVVLRAGGRRLTMDVGPLGYLSIAAHGHADALAVTLSLDGSEVISDPGTASYYGHPAWRQVHRGTRAHPTVTVDDENQSVPGGPFLWTDHARVQVHAVDTERGIVDAEHDGYRRLSDPVTHRRWLFAPPDEWATILVVDEVVGSGDHEMRVSWPLHPELELETADCGTLLTRERQATAQVSMATASHHLTYDQVRGDGDTQLGWWSGRLESRVPSWLLGGIVRGAAPLLTATIIRPLPSRGAAVTRHDVSRAGELITVSWWVGDERHEVVIDRSLPGAVRVRTRSGP